MDYNIRRPKAVLIIGLVALVAGFPSAYSLEIFNNQDWVWGIGLLLSGFFFIFFVLKFGVVNFKEQILEYQKKNLFFNQRVLKFLFSFMVFEFLVMCTWWFFQSVSWYPRSWWNPVEEFTIGTCIFQWTLLIMTGIIFNRKLSAFE
jgi:NSS family neurotransmitter:Na+ symporter